MTNDQDRSVHAGIVTLFQYLILFFDIHHIPVWWLGITDTTAGHLLGLFGHVACMNNGIPACDALDCASAHCTKIRPPDG